MIAAAQLLDEWLFFLICSVFFVLTTLGCVVLGSKIIWNAIVSGHLEARNGIYDRRRQPALYYAGIASFWVFASAISAMGSYGAIVYGFLPSLK